MKTIYKYSILALSMSAMIACEKEIQPETNADETATKNAMSSGEAGSMSQFAIVDEYLYTVDYKTLHVFLIGDANTPIEVEKIDLGIGIETIYPQDGHLFIGTQSGVRIYDISNPRSPIEVSEFEHTTSCDPVIALGEIAIATLRGGTECGGNLNQMDLFDISDISNPTLINSQLLNNPYGLGFSEVNPSIVYICDGYSGLKVFDISDVNNIEIKNEYSDLEAVDVISTSNNNLIVLTKTGIYQFDCSDPINLIEKSFIPVN